VLGVHEWYPFVFDTVYYFMATTLNQLWYIPIAKQISIPETNHSDWLGDSSIEISHGVKEVPKCKK